jgi:hypothetical protein
MIEDLVGNIGRSVDGLADEIAKRIAGDTDANPDKVRSHVRQVLYEWFLGDFIPHKIEKDPPA